MTNVIQTEGDKRKIKSDVKRNISFENLKCY